MPKIFSGPVAPKIERGSVVRLKSGGPPMVVLRKGQYGDEWECATFLGSQDCWTGFIKAWIAEIGLELLPA